MAFAIFFLRAFCQLFFLSFLFFLLFCWVVFCLREKTRFWFCGFWGVVSEFSGTRGRGKFQRGKMGLGVEQGKWGTVERWQWVNF